MLTNYHCHTFRCQHAVGTDREYVLAAIKAGYTTLGFSDHCPWLNPDGYHSTIRLTPGQVPDYIRSLLALREEFASRIRILIGFECEYFPAQDAWQRDFFASLPLDYLILGQHCFDSERGTYFVFPTKDEALLGRSVDLLIEALETGRYLYPAHPDLFNFQGPEAPYRKHFGRLCEYLHDHHLPVEINRLGIATHRHYTSDRFLSLASEYGLSAIIGIDAHDPAQLLDHAGREACIAMARRHHLPLVDSLPLKHSL